MRSQRGWHINNQLTVDLFNCLYFSLRHRSIENNNLFVETKGAEKCFLAFVAAEARVENNSFCESHHKLLNSIMLQEGDD